MGNKLIFICYVLFSMFLAGSNGCNKHHMVDPTKHRNWKLVNPNNCGLSAHYNNRIVGGKNSGLGQFPWLVQLGGRMKAVSKIFFMCGGTIINSRYVITAAHCDDPDFRKLRRYVRVGELDKKHNPSCLGKNKRCAPRYIDYEIESIKLPKGIHGFRTNDIALVRTKLPIKFNDFVKPICLEYGQLLKEDHAGKDLVVAGWGYLNSTTRKVPKILQFVYEKGVTSKECAKSWSSVTNRHICTVSPRGKDSCQGDSGGPLHLISDMSGKPRNYLVGLVSYGQMICGASDMPSVFTRIKCYLTWILNHMRP